MIHFIEKVIPMVSYPSISTLASVLVNYDLSMGYHTWGDLDENAGIKKYILLVDFDIFFCGDWNCGYRNSDVLLFKSAEFFSGNTVEYYRCSADCNKFYSLYCK